MKGGLVAEKKPKLAKNDVVVVSLNQIHLQDAASFLSGDEDMNAFLRQDALPNQSKKLSETFLLYEKSTKRLISYITLSFGSFKISTNREIGGIPIRDKPFRIYTDNIPCYFIARLATGKSEEGRGGGTLLVEFAVKRGSEICEKYPLPFVALDSEPANVPYYEARGFSVAFKSDSGKNEKVQMYFQLSLPKEDSP